MKKIATIALCLWLMGTGAGFGQHVLQLLPASAADAPVLGRYRLPLQQSDSAVALQQAQSLLQQLYADGYLLARFTAFSQTSDTTKVTLTIGAPYQWLSLGPGNVDERQLRQAGYREHFYKQKTFSYKQLSELMKRLLKQAENSGYPFALVKLDSLEVDPNAIAASLYFEPGPFITFDSLQLSGDVSIQHRFLASHLGIMPGAPYNQQRIDEVVQKLEELPYLQLAEAPSLSFQNREARLTLNLKKQSANRLDGILGIQSKPAGGVLLTGQLDMLLQNPFGGGKTLALNWQRLNEESQRLELAYRHPNLLNSPLTIALKGSILKEQEQFLNRKAAVALQGRQHAGLLLSLEYQFKDSRLLDKAAGPDLASFRVHQYGLRGVYERLDQRLFPRQGFMLEGSVLAGPKEVSSVADGSAAKTGKSMQLTTELQAQAFWPLASRTIVAFKTAGALLLDENLFFPDLYRLGGLQSLRGFREQSLFASRYVLFQTELRQQLGNTSFVFLFYDQGFLDYQLPAASYQDWPFGAGAGLSLQTGAGQFNLVYALGHQQAQPFSLRNSQVHFGYTSRF